MDQPGDLAVVLRVLYLIYPAGHAGRVDLAGEAIRLARQLTLSTDGDPDAEEDGGGLAPRIFATRGRIDAPPAERCPRMSEAHMPELPGGSMSYGISGG